VLEHDAYKCSITCTSGADSASGALLDVTPIIPPSIGIRTLSWYAGLSSGDPLCESTLRFYRLKNMLTLDDDTSDVFRSLNVWLKGTVRSIPRLTLDTTFSLNFRICPSRIAAFAAFLGLVREGLF
jgi:hypothetical protein